MSDPNTKTFLEQEVGESNLRFLQRIEASGDYLFHGSQNKDITVLEPRQAYSSDGEVEKNDLAVYASELFGTAVQRAIVNLNASENSVFGMHRSTFPDRSPKFTIKVAGKVVFGPGVVYVLSKKDFLPSTGDSWKAKSTVTPLTKVVVDRKLYEEMGGEVVVEDFEKFKESSSK